MYILCYIFNSACRRMETRLASKYRLKQYIYIYIFHRGAMVLDMCQATIDCELVWCVFQCACQATFHADQWEVFLVTRVARQQHGLDWHRLTWAIVYCDAALITSVPPGSEDNMGFYFGDDGCVYMQSATIRTLLEFTHWLLYGRDVESPSLKHWGKYSFPLKIDITAKSWIYVIKPAQHLNCQPIVWTNEGNFQSNRYLSGNEYKFIKKSWLQLLFLSLSSAYTCIYRCTLVSYGLELAS